MDLSCCTLKNVFSFFDSYTLILSDLTQKVFGFHLNDSVQPHSACAAGDENGKLVIYGHSGVHLSHRCPGDTNYDVDVGGHRFSSRKEQL